ncbi:Z1 domain-containing protein [Bradyrhizobium sp. HKCCYLRH1030]|uniref:Z1 domain-containing protein n=1 Tax=Bradyrhizobium sp. HKCCYLRH1030 TaxID=3420744 RepID=UPI003EBE8C98
MPVAAVNAAEQQAIGFTEKLIEKYSTAVAAGEVGPDGSAVATEEPILANRSPTMLMYGRVQSGKTAAMILTSALCLDNGFRVIVVLTSDNLILVEQTANRFRALSGPRVFSTRRPSMGRYEWEGLEDELRDSLPEDGIVLVSAKNDIHLGQIVAFLQEIDAPSYPTLIFDDEADAATPDTTVKARAEGRASAPDIPSAIHRRVFDNPKTGQEGESLGEIFPHKLYVQVTATPYVFFLQPPESPIRPDETLLLEAGAGYCGGEQFFEAFDPTDSGDPPPPLVLVPPNELQAISRRQVPSGLARSIDFFLIAATTCATAAGRWPEEGFKHLSHASASIGHHTMLENHVRRHLTEVRRLLRRDRAGAIERFGDAYQELTRTVQNPPALEALIDRLRTVVEQDTIIVFNSETELPRDPGPRINFFIGGNILGRGLTIEDLLVTYYVREAKVSQMDTVWQHARMYGYRNDLMPYTRVFVPRGVAANFRGIHESENSLRDLLSRDPAGTRPILLVPRGTRATRPNAVDSSYLRVIPAGTEQVIPRRIRMDATLAQPILQKLEELRVPIVSDDREARVTAVPFQEVIDLVNAVPLVEDDPGLWNPDAVIEILNNYRQQNGDFGFVYVRKLDGDPSRTRARLSGNEVRIIRQASNNLPALVLLYVGDAARPEGWYPTLVMPTGSPNFIISPPDE